jgi:hypothetical protein
MQRVTCINGVEELERMAIAMLLGTSVGFER